MHVLCDDALGVLLIDGVLQHALKLRDVRQAAGGETWVTAGQWQYTGSARLGEMISSEWMKEA